MTIRVRLAVAFFLLVLGPLVIGVGLILGGLAGERADPGPRQAAIAVRAAVSARCDALAVTARVLADHAADTGVSFVASPDGEYGPWAICGVGSSAVPLTPGTRYGALAARAEIRGADGGLRGYAYALQPLDEAYLRQLSVAAGHAVFVHPAGEVLGPDDVEPDVVSPLPLALGASESGAGSALATATAVVGTAVALASICGWWLAGIATRPLTTLLSAVEQVAGGDLSARSRVHGCDEAGRLGSGLDRLIAGMQENQRLSMTDPLTGLANLRQLRESLRMEVERAARFRRTVGVMVIDLDHFKSVNDRHGHRAGDAVLVEFARRVRRVVREVDLVFRQGGEEFVILLPETDVAGSLTAARRIVVAVRDQPFPVLPRAADGQAAETPGFVEIASRVEAAGSAAVQVPVTVSVGVSVFPRHGVTGSEVLDAADRALYAAKAAGRDTYVLATASALDEAWQPIRPTPTRTDVRPTRAAPAAGLVGQAPRDPGEPDSLGACRTT